MTRYFSEKHRAPNLGPYPMERLKRSSHAIGDVPVMQANRFDRALRRLLANRTGCRFVEVDFEPDISRMSPDGFHPGPKIYAEWGRKVYRAIRRDVKQLGDPNLR